MPLVEWYNSLSDYEKILVKETIRLGYLNSTYPRDTHFPGLGILGLLDPERLSLAFYRRRTFMGGFDHLTDSLDSLEKSVSLCS